MKPLIIDALAVGKGRRIATRDVIGAGPRSIAGILEDEGIEPKIITAEKILQKPTQTKNYDLALISGMTSDLPSIQRICRQWKKNNTSPIVLGGPVCSEPVRALEKTTAQVAVIGEGELTQRELLREINDVSQVSEYDLSNIRGIAYRTGDKIEVNELRPVIPKADYIGFTPSTNTIGDYPLHYAARVYVEVLRGCSNYRRSTLGSVGEKCVDCGICYTGELEERYNCPVGIPPGCGYCSVPSLYGPPKSRTSAKIVEEVQELIDHGVKRIVLSAPGFLDYGREDLVEPSPLTDPRNPEPNIPRIEELLSDLYSIPEITRREVSLIIENIKGGLVTVEAANVLGRYLKDSPVNLGFETGSDEHAKVLGRPDTPTENLRALKRLRDAGMKPYVYFIHGLPGQTEETVNDTVRRIRQTSNYGADRIILYRFSSLPMTAFSDCPSGPPAERDPFSRQIREEALKVNQRSKDNLVGKRVRAVVAEPYSRNRGLLVAYPMLHGPVILIDNMKGLIGKVVDVLITDIRSERLVKGTVDSLCFKERV